MRSLLLVLLTLVTVTPAPQQFDFSGTWVATKDVPKGVEAAPSPVFGARFAIAMDGGNVALSRVSRDGTFVATLPLGGADVTLRIPGRACEGDSQRIEKIAMEGNALAYTLVGTTSPGAAEPRIINVKYLLRPESPDTIAVQGTLVQQGQSKPVATVYKRSAETMPALPAATAPFKGAPARIAQAEWIGATWIGTGANNLTVEERWVPPASGAMLGLGRSVRGPLMSSFEFLCIAERDGTLVYFAMPNARMPATPFTLTAITADSATFENPSHDFPKLIRYSKLPDGSLQTTISGGAGTRETNFVLKKQ